MTYKLHGLFIREDRLIMIIVLQITDLPYIVEINVYT